jgi:putative transposase
MPRRPRLKLDGCPLHLIQRGNNRSAGFFGDEDYQHYLDWLGEAARAHGVAVHAYVLMTNHVHLLVTPERADGASRVMKQLGQRYVQHINRARARSGTLWEGRFRSCLVAAEDHLLNCCRYIELNPVRARMVRHAAEYRWSSHRANAEGAPSTVLTPHPLVAALGPTAAARQAAYRALFETVPEPELIDRIRRATNGGYALGSERFVRQIAAITGRRAAPGAPGRPPKQGRDGG